MQLTQKNGQLALASIYKLFYIGWVIACGGLVLIIGLIGFILALFSFVLVPDLAPDIMVQSLFLILIGPAMIALQGLIFAAMLTLGIWLYSLFRPVTVSEADIDT